MTEEQVYWLPVFLGIGISLYFALMFEPSLACVVGGATLVIAVYGCYPQFLTKLALITTTGFLLAYARTHRINTVFLAHTVHNVVLAGEVQSIEYFPDKKRLVLGNVESHDTIPQTVRLRLWKNQDIMVGDRLKVLADLTTLSHPPTPHSFDYKRDAYFKGIGATGRIKKIYTREEATDDTLRHRIARYLRGRIAGPSKEIAVALVLGDKTGIPKTIRDQFSAAGMAHLLAISGLHLSLITGVIFFLFRLLCCVLLGERYNNQKIAALCSIVGVGVYAMLSGFGYPVLRAYVMVTLYMIALMIDRTALSMRSVALAALMILVVQPESLMSASFQLSFAAVIPLIVLWEHMTKVYVARVVRWFLGLFLTTVVATLATMPLSALIFHQITLQALLGNMLAIPFFTFCVIPSMLFGLCTGMLGLWAWSLHGLIRIAASVGALPGAVISVPACAHNGTMGLFVAGGLWLCLHQARTRYWGFALMVLGLLAYGPAHVPDYFVAENINAWHEGYKLMTTHPKRGKYYLEEWAKVYGLTIEKAVTEKVFPWDRGAYFVFKDQTVPMCAYWGKRPWC